MQKSTHKHTQDTTDNLTPNNQGREGYLFGHARVLFKNKNKRNHKKHVPKRKHQSESMSSFTCSIESSYERPCLSASCSGPNMITFFFLLSRCSISLKIEVCSSHSAKSTRWERSFIFLSKLFLYSVIKGQKDVEEHAEITGWWRYTKFCWRRHSQAAEVKSTHSVGKRKVHRRVKWENRLTKAPVKTQARRTAMRRSQWNKNQQKRPKESKDRHHNTEYRDPTRRNGWHEREKVIGVKVGCKKWRSEVQAWHQDE